MSAGAGMIQVRIRHPQIMDHHRVILHPMTVHRHLQVQEASMPVGEILEAEDLAEIFNSPPRHNTSAGVNKQKMKKYKYFKDQVAKQKGFKDEDHLAQYAAINEEAGVLDAMYDEAAELYAAYRVGQARKPIPIAECLPELGQDCIFVIGTAYNAINGKSDMPKYAHGYYTGRGFVRYGDGIIFQPDEWLPLPNIGPDLHEAHAAQLLGGDE